MSFNAFNACAMDRRVQDSPGVQGLPELIGTVVHPTTSLEGVNILQGLPYHSGDRSVVTPRASGQNIPPEALREIKG